MSTDENATAAGNTDTDQQTIIEKLKGDVKKSNARAKDLAKLIAQREKEDALEEELRLEEWQPVQTQYVASYLDKCVLRMNLHEDSARYYNKRHYYIIIPATVLGAVSSTAAFTQWSSTVLNGGTNVMWLVVGFITALTTLLHNLSEFVFGFKDKARQHQQSFINFSRLVKRIDNEYNNPAHEHKPYRQFIESISEDYDRYTEHALMVPDSVNSVLRARWLKKFETDKMNAAPDNSSRNAPAENIVVIDNDHKIVEVEKKKKKKRKSSRVAKKEVNPDVELLHNNALGTAIDARNVGINLQRVAGTAPVTFEPLLPQAPPVSVTAALEDDPSNDVIERFRLRNQILRQNREARRMTMNQYPETFTRPTFAPPITTQRQQARRFSQFDKRQQDMHRARTVTVETDFEHLPYNSIIELNSMTSSDHSIALNKQAQPRPMINDNDEQEPAPNVNQRKTHGKHTVTATSRGMPELRTGIEESNGGDEDKTPEELRSIHSGIVHYNE